MVDHGQEGSVAPLPSVELHGGVRGVLGGVLDEVDEDPGDVVPVGAHRQVGGLDGGGGLDGDHPVDLGEQLRDGDRLEVHGDGPPVDTGDDEEVVDEPLESAGLAPGADQQLL